MPIHLCRSNPSESAGKVDSQINVKIYMEQQTLPPAFVKQLPLLVFFFLSYFIAALIPCITKRNDVENVDAYLILFSNFLGLTFSLVLLYFVFIPLESLRKIGHNIFVSSLCICFTIFAASPCIVLFLRRTIYVAYVSYPISSIMLVFVCLFKENTGVEDCEPANLLYGACSNAVFSIGAMVFNILCFITTSTSSTSSLGYGGYEFDISLVLYFISIIFGFSAITSIIFPLIPGRPLGKFTITIAKSFTGLSSFLLLAAVVCFAANFVGIHMFYSLIITPVPSFYLAVGYWIKPNRAKTPAADDMVKVWNACATLNLTLLMTVLQNYTASTGSDHVAFHFFVIMSIAELFYLQVQMLLALHMPAVEEGLRAILFKVIIFLQVGAFVCFGLA